MICGNCKKTHQIEPHLIFCGTTPRKTKRFLCLCCGSQYEKSKGTVSNDGRHIFNGKIQAKIHQSTMKGRVYPGQQASFFVTARRGNQFQAMGILPAKTTSSSHHSHKTSRKKSLSQPGNTHYLEERISSDKNHHV